MKKVVTVILFNLLMIFLILALFEGTLYYLVRHPDVVKKSPKGIRNSIGYLYAAGERKVIQFMPECARYDSGLGYTLKPGSCVFSATEFSNRYDVNREGLRDDEASLKGPEIIVTGDSYAMGWGVDQNESFASVLEKKSGRKVLNAAIASYGTAREMMMLGRLDTRNLKFLVIQYCENDEDENRAFHEQGNRLKTMSPDEYRHFTDLNGRDKGYYPGKYLSLKWEKKWKEIRAPEAGKGPAGSSRQLDDVDLFINAVLHSLADLSKVRIIVLEAVGKDDFDRTFVRRLAERVKAGNYPPPVKNLETLDITKFMTIDHYYVLDDHWRKAGHDAIAAEIFKLIQKQS
jgi:hypothetical protein